MLINTQPTLDSYRYFDAFCHFLHALIHQLRLFHKTGPKRAFLYPGTRTPNIQVDLIIPILLSNDRSLCKKLRIASSQLEHNRVLDWVEWQNVVVVMDDGTMVQHFGVKSGFLCYQSHEVTEMGVCDVLKIK